MVWADQRNFWRLLPAGSQRSEEGVLENAPEAVEAWAVNLQQRFDGRPVAVCLEQSRGPLVYMLSKYPHLVLFPVHPTTAARYRETFTPSGATPGLLFAPGSRRRAGGKWTAVGG